MLILGGEVDVEMGGPPSDEMKREKETFFERDLARVDRLKPGEENLLRRLYKMRIRGRAFDVADRSIVGIGGDEDMTWLVFEEIIEEINRDGGEFLRVFLIGFPGRFFADIRQSFFVLSFVRADPDAAHLISSRGYASP